MFDLLPVNPEIKELFSSFMIHHLMLSDKIRMDALSQVIAVAVKPGDTVLDLGAGTGILAFLAIRAGAKRVYAIEQTEIIELAKLTAYRNGMNKKIVFIQNESQNVKLPEKVDIVICETLGHLGITENFIDNMIDARNRFLKKGGILIPQELKIFLAPSKDKKVSKYIGLWNGNENKLDFSPIFESAIKTAYIGEFNPSMFLSTPKEIISINLYSIKSSRINNIIEFILEKEGKLYGFCGWFTANLYNNININTSPTSKRTHWKQCFFPLINPEKVFPGTKIKLKLGLSYIGNKIEWSWQAKFL